MRYFRSIGGVRPDFSIVILYTMGQLITLLTSFIYFFIILNYSSLDFSVSWRLWITYGNGAMAMHHANAKETKPTTRNYGVNFEALYNSPIFLCNWGMQFNLNLIQLIS